MGTYRRLIVVLGASGRQGNHVVRSLLDEPDRWKIRGVTNDLQAISMHDLLDKDVELVPGDINSREQCARIFEGAYGVFAVTNNWEAKSIGEYQQAINIIDAAKEAGVKHFIFSLFPDLADQRDEAHPGERIEIYLRQLASTSTFAYTTLIRVGYYYQNFMTFFLADAPTSEFRYPQLPPVRIPLYDARDTGKIVVECFRQPEKYANTNEVIPIVAEQLTIEEICAQIKQFFNKEIQLVELTDEDARRKLNSYLVTTLRWYCSHRSTDENQAQVTTTICPQMKTFVDWLEEMHRLLE